MPYNLRPRVLCVDDDEDTCVMLGELLRLSLIEAEAVATATEALLLIQAKNFNLYLLDAQLPDLDGFELCRRLRQIDPETPILFFSGSDSDGNRKKAIDAGADAYLLKPDVESLVGRITTFLLPAESTAA